jgi:hypothetical protein
MATGTARNPHRFDYWRPGDALAELPWPLQVSWRVSKTEALRIAGAANSTIGNIKAQETSHERIQLAKNSPVANSDRLAIDAATAEVRPDRMTPKTKCA